MPNLDDIMPTSLDFQEPNLDVSPVNRFNEGEHTPKRKLSMSKISRSIRILVIVLVAGAVAAAVYYFNQYRTSQKQLHALQQNPEQAARQSAQELVDKVGKLVVLPVGEDPTIATVTDPEKLKDQAFFANAKKDDKVLIYTNAKKAFLYNPTTNKVVEIAPINIGADPAIKK